MIMLYFDQTAPYSINIEVYDYTFSTIYLTLSIDSSSINPT